ncbi:MAG: class I SAM-dependent RNA methyltransferase [Rhizobiaceae bacterium]
MAEILIDKVGSLGDGMGQLNNGTVFVPGTLAGEKVRAKGEAPRLDLVEVLEPSTDRITPTCKHFGICGGCSLQHMKSSAMLEWKREEVALAFSRAKIEVKIEPCIPSSPRSRRRVTLTARRNRADVTLGFYQRGSSDVVNIEHCTILIPEIETQFDAFRSLATTLLRGNEDIQITINGCENGLDLDFSLEQTPSEDMLAAFVRAFAKTPFLRAALEGDVIVEKEKPVVTFDDAKVAVPSGGFLQAVVEAEVAMAELVCNHLSKRKRVVDLFSGSGTFSLRLAKKSRVHAVETEELALSALASAGGADGLKSITTLVRDLEELPLMASELKLFDGVCIDPPRAGAEPQIREIAKADIRALAYVSCNPTTLARDAAILLKAGYKIERVIPVDQFLYSPHIEVVALFSKTSQKSDRSIFR